MGIPAIFKSISRLVTVLPCEVETLRAERKRVKRRTEEITALCTKSANQASQLVRYVNEKVPGPFQALGLTIESKLKQ